MFSRTKLSVYFKKYINVYSYLRKYLNICYKKFIWSCYVYFLY